ncbi:MAG: hypothetical protein ACXVBE_13175 [Bdellovibrionota bacterium]
MVKLSIISSVCIVVIAASAQAASICDRVYGAANSREKIVCKFYEGLSYLDENRPALENCTLGCDPMLVMASLTRIKKGGFPLSPNSQVNSWAPRQISSNLHNLGNASAFEVIRMIANASKNGVKIDCEELGAIPGFTQCP